MIKAVNTENLKEEKLDNKVVELATRELRQFKDELQVLPAICLNKLELDASWDEVQASMDQSSSNKAPTWAWMSFAACSALVGVFAFMMSSSSSHEQTQDLAPLEAAITPDPVNIKSELDLRSLKEFNRIVDNRLQALPDSPRLVRANTMDTIARLEDQIALLDYRLNLQEQQPLSEEEYHALWQQRAKSVNGLYQVKAAQVQRSQQASLYQPQTTFQRVAYYE